MADFENIVVVGTAAQLQKLLNAESYADQNMKQYGIQDAGFLSLQPKSSDSGEDTINLFPRISVKDESERTEYGILELYASQERLPVLLKGIKDGLDDSDAANVGQVKQIVSTEVGKIEKDTNAVVYDPQELTDEQKAQARENIGAMQSGAANSDLDMQGFGVDDVSHISFSKIIVDGGVSKFFGFNLSAIKSGAETAAQFYGEGNSPIRITGIADGVDDNDAATFGQLLDKVVRCEKIANRTTVIDENADDDHYPSAKAVYDLFGNITTDGGVTTGGNGFEGYKLLAETVLTEDSKQIKWTQTSTGEELTNYKDFFILWSGRFTATANEAYICHSNNGARYHCYAQLQKTEGVNVGGWFKIDEIYMSEDGKTGIVKSTYPNNFLKNISTTNSMTSQGLADNNRPVSSDIAMSEGSYAPTSSIVFGGTSSATSLFAAGTKALLLGRARSVKEENDTVVEKPDEEYFGITSDGVASLKPEYQANGSKNEELPEIIVIPDAINGTAVSALAANMFEKNQRVKSVTIPGHITDIPEKFCNLANNLEEINGTENVESIGSAAFQRCSVRKAMFHKLKTISGGGHFNQCPYLSIVDIGNTVSSIPDGCFTACESLSLVLGGASVTSIGGKSFSSTRSLKNLPFVANVKTIGKQAFELSRVNFDWWNHAFSSVGDNGTPAKYNPTQWWAGCTYEACENPLGSTFNQNDPRWADIKIQNHAVASNPAYIFDTYGKGCTEISAAHIYSALTGVKFDSPRFFVENIVGGIENGRLLTSTGTETDDNKISGPAYNFSDMANWLTELDLECELAADDDTETTYLQKIYNALKEGALILTGINPGHAGVIYGVASNGEMLVLDSASYLYAIGVYEARTFQQPIWSLTTGIKDAVIVRNRKVV